MKRVKKISVLAGITLSVCLAITTIAQKENMNAHIKNLDDFVQLLPSTPEDICTRTELYKKSMALEVEAIIAIPANNRSFDNTVAAYDRITETSDAGVWSKMLSVCENTHPDADVRNAAHEAQIQLQAFFVDAIASNKQLFNALREYDLIKDSKDKLNDAQKYALDQIIKSYRRAGIDLPDDQLALVTALRKQIQDLSLAFARTIAEESRQLEVRADGLIGLAPDWLATLKRTPDGNYVLGTDYPTCFMIMENCAVQKTREDLYLLFQNRGYPANHAVLEQLIAKRDELARLIGFATYAHLDLDAQMVGCPERAEQFLTEVIVHSRAKEEKELALLCADLPESVTLTADGKFKPWDMAYLKNEYKKKHFQLDEREIARYLPMDNTIKELLDIYRTFMSIEFEEIACAGLWHEDVRALKVYNQDKSHAYGYLLLDLYPRPNKYKHAAHLNIIPALCDQPAVCAPAVSCVMANFARGQADKPALLTRADAGTFFHEFGHALHAFLGGTQLAGQSGTRVKRDFVELPSQMLEEWLYDQDILRKVTCHYQTGESLPVELINKIMTCKQFDAGSFVQRQAMLALYSLKLFEGIPDPQELWRCLHEQYSSAFMYDERAHHYAAFGHLTEYGAKYYGYLWSKVFALDIFEEIKRHGLLDPVIGKKYVNEVIGKGGSQDPNELLENFLGRKPDQRAFLAGLAG